MANGRLLVSAFLLLAVEGRIVVAEQAPELLGPPDGSTVVLSRSVLEPQELLLLVERALGWRASSIPHRPPVVFSWQSVGERATYRLLVARARDFNRPMVDRTTAGTSEAVHCLGPGVYYWKVTAGDVSSSVGSFILR